jgi:hypothetical protein
MSVVPCDTCWTSRATSEGVTKVSPLMTGLDRHDELRSGGMFHYKSRCAGLEGTSGISRGVVHREKHELDAGILS